MLEALSAAGWVTLKPHVLADRAGREFDLTVAAPAKLQQAFFADVQQEQADEAAALKLVREKLDPSILQFGVDAKAVRRVAGARGKKRLQRAEKLSLVAA